ncbi:MAG: UvrD-helicase domain-containing protein [Gemmatimonadaceae bacterium]
MSTNLLTPSDEPARASIRSALDTNMLVEAGAGSGKTTLMVDRLLAYIARGTLVDQLAAVTFTKKAANELRQRLEVKMEAQSREQTGEVREHFLVALRDRERMFMGTVHAFCGRILREHALDAGLPPDFTELDQEESKTLRDSHWRSFIEHSARDSSGVLAQVAAVGIDPLSLFAAYADREQYRDVEFTAPVLPCPPHETVRNKLVAFIARARELRVNPGPERDDLQKTLDRLRRAAQLHNDWESASDFAHDVTALLSASARKVTQKHWGDDKNAKLAAKNFGLDVDSFVENELTPWLESWWAHAYAPTVALLNAGSEWAQRQRRRAGLLGFDDLLTETARLLRTHATVRQTVGERWRYLLVDEFQDTDPVQAEVCFLIASESSDGNDWRSVTLRDGALFVVGDPKQSIYRFRRADLAMYRFVEQRIAQCGQVVHLTRNFRSVPSVGDLVNDHFSSVFVTSETSANGEMTPHAQWQAPFARFEAASKKSPSIHSGIKRYQIGQSGNATNTELIAEDAALVASWVARRCSAGDSTSYGDFLILTPRKGELAEYAHELALRNIPVDVTGAANTIDEVLQELLIIVRALADPGNPIAVIAALEGWCVGCSHQDLWDAHEAELEFRITHAPTESESPAGAGLQQLYRWWIVSQRLPAASLLERVMDDSGLLMLAASSDLGDVSAGQLMQLVSALRNSARTDLTAAIETIEQSLGQEDEAPTLRVARTNAVRLMNLHKAKGLEAPIVILAAPKPGKPREPRMATWRSSDGLPQGAFRIVDDNKRILAQPANWATLAAEEQLRELAERDRLLYVAVTRAEQELVVSQRATYFTAKGEARPDTSQWAPLAPALLRHATELQLSIDEPPGRKTVTTTAQEFHDGIDAANGRLQNAKQPRYELVSVTEAAKRNAAQADDDGASLESELSDAAEIVEDESGQTTAENDRSGNAANRYVIDPREFGSLVHLALEGALRGRDEQQLTRYVGAHVWHTYPKLNERARELLVTGVMRAVRDAQNSAAWSMLKSSTGSALAELNVANVAGQIGQQVLSEGIVDAACETADGWLVVDWKINRSSDAQWQRQLVAYQAQAAAYVSAFLTRTGTGGTVHIERLQGSAQS